TLLKVENISGSVEASNGQLHLKEVKEATIFIVCNTSFYHQDFKKENAETIQALSSISYNELFESHIKDYQKLYKRVTFSLSGKELDSLPTNERLERVKQGKTD